MVSQLHDNWRAEFRPIIEAVIRHEGLRDPKRLRAALRAAYPLPWRRLCPSRIWLEQVREACDGAAEADALQTELFQGEGW